MQFNFFIAIYVIFGMLVTGGLAEQYLVPPDVRIKHSAAAASSLVAGIPFHNHTVFTSSVYTTVTVTRCSTCAAGGGIFATSVPALPVFNNGTFSNDTVLDGPIANPNASAPVKDVPNLHNGTFKITPGNASNSTNTTAPIEESSAACIHGIVSAAFACVLLAMSLAVL